VSSVFDLTGRTALITGVGSPTGIGFATARLLTEMGASVVITSTTDRIHERVRELEAAGGEAVGIVGDLTDPATAPQLVAAALERSGRLDVVVHNAGMTSINEPRPGASGIAEMDFAEWRASLARNLDATFLMAKACLPVMSAEGWGRVVLVSSITGPIMAMRGKLAYAAAKSGVVGLARALAIDSAPSGVTVNAIAPGWIQTGSQSPHEHHQGQLTPMGRSAQPTEVAAAICWLASPGASYMTGQCLVVDGGNSIAEERA
jgi:3-oxoacyl-[acyl-carrier protein] reductase